MKTRNALTEKEYIMYLVNCMIEAISPRKIYLFGSLASGNFTKDSDYDFYIIVGDNRNEAIIDITTTAYKSIRGKKNRPVDIVISKESTYEERKNWMLSLEQEVNKNGILLYCKDV